MDHASVFYLLAALLAVVGLVGTVFGTRCSQEHVDAARLGDLGEANGGGGVEGVGAKVDPVGHGRAV